MSSASDNEEIAVKTTAPVEATGGKRERKQTAFFSTTTVANTTKHAPETIEEGNGILLAEYDYFVEKLGKLKSDDDVVKALHSLMYGTPGKKTETKKNLRAFRGFPANSNVEELVNKVTEKKKIWTVSLLKQALELFGCERSGDRDTLCSRLVNYLAQPENLKKVSGSKRKSSSGGDGKRKKNKKSSKKTKKVKGPSRVSGFILFSKASRAVLKEKKPELTFTEVAGELGRLWKSLSPDEQKEWNEQAEEVNLAVAEGASSDKQGEEEEEEEEEEGEEQGSDEEEEEEANGAESDE